MAVQKTVMYKILAIALVFLVWRGSSERVAAAPKAVKLWESKTEYSNYYKISTFSYDSEDYSKINYLVFRNANGEYDSVFWSYEPVVFSYNQYDVTYNMDGSVRNVTKDSSKTYNTSNFTNRHTLSDGTQIYTPVSVGMDQDIVTSSYIRTVTLFTDVYNCPTVTRYLDALELILVGDLKPENNFKPNWVAVGDDPLLYIKNLQAEIVDGNIEVAWEPQPDVPYKYLENIYINFSYHHKTPGHFQSTVLRNRYYDTGKFANMKDLSISIPLSELDMPEFNVVTSLRAQPFFYIGDDTSNNTKRGQASIIYFSEDGLSSSPIIVAPDIQDELPVENVEQNIFVSIQNFFSNFWRNLVNSIKTAVVPESEDVLALLNEMNDWFSDRFGFIWYPFDLAIDIVAAFAIGEPNSKFTVPALTLNMLGGIKLWDSFEVDLDPIGFLQYVRFFTSTIMCCGTVSLAIRKWDEWIGGEN